MRINGCACLAVLCLALAGCAIDGADRPSFREGWRAAEVIRIAGPGDLVRRPYRDCRNAQSSTQSETVVELAYHLTSLRSHTLLVSVPPTLDLQEGDIVYVRDSTCEFQLHGAKDLRFDE